MVKTRSTILLATLAMAWTASLGDATVIEEILEPPDTPGNAFSGTFLITPSQPVWAFGVGNPDIQDVSISGIAFIDGLKARDHWIAALISKDAWTDTDGDGSGFDFNSIRPINATAAAKLDMVLMAGRWHIAIRRH